MPFTYEICGALSVLDNFRHYHAQQFAQTIADPADIYFATDAVTHSLVIRIRGVLTDDEAEIVENALGEFSQKWARTGSIFRRVRYGEPSCVPVGLGSKNSPMSTSSWRRFSNAKRGFSSNFDQWRARARMY